MLRGCGNYPIRLIGDVAQMVERAVSIGEVKGSMPFFSISFYGVAVD